MRFSKSLLEKAKMGVGDQVEVIAEEGQIIVKTPHQIRGKYRIRDLVARMPKHYKPKEISFRSAMEKTSISLLESLTR